MPIVKYAAEVEGAIARTVAGEFNAAAQNLVDGTLARLVPAPEYPGGPDVCRAHAELNWSGERVAANTAARLLAEVKDLVDNHVAKLPESVKDHVAATIPAWTGLTDMIDAVRNRLESFEA